MDFFYSKLSGTNILIGLIPMMKSNSHVCNSKAEKVSAHILLIDFCHGLTNRKVIHFMMSQLNGLVPNRWQAIILTWMHSLLSHKGITCPWWAEAMVTSSDGIIFRVTGPLWGESTGQHVALMFFLFCTRTTSWANNRDTGDLRCRPAH